MDPTGPQSRSSVLIMSFSVVLFTFTLLGITKGSDSDPSSFNFDPYLQYRPEFARSLPIQILLTGIVLALCSVLFTHLIFTAQYHWPLAPLNFILQMSGVTSLLITLFATLHVILSASIKESQEWPYMLSYIAVHVPNTDGSVISRATWSVMNAWTAGIIQITHIQFLTLLYPSHLEATLIFGLLVPLTLVSAAMQLLLISSNNGINLIASAIHNVCNATLSLLFTAALFLWGFFINRNQAWRFEGGTAVFGGTALALALVGTALNFLYVPREEEYLWLPGLMRAVILWQSFLGWWWWVGAGRWYGTVNSNVPVEEMISRMEKRERQKRERHEKRKETRERARMALKGVAQAFVKNRRPVRSEGEGSSPSPPATPPPRIERSTSRTDSPPPPTSTDKDGHRSRILPNFVYNWYWIFRHAHQAAARQQTAEQQERIREFESFSWWGSLRRWRLQNVTSYP